MKRRLKEVTEVLDIPASAAAVLLREHNWSKEILLEVFYSNSDKILRKCGVYHRCHPTITTAAGAAVAAAGGNKATTKKAAAAAQADVVCAICYDAPEKTLTMPCGHEFCTNCWLDFCINSISEGPVCVRMTCPQAGCKEVVTEEEVAQVCKQAELSRFQTFQLRSFVESNSLTRWCPGKGCERVACAYNPAAMEADNNVAHCDGCLISFCMICGEEPHSPCGCKDLAKWNEKCRNESETANWILANTKSCPKCFSRIEKNQGCNHMSCQRCKFEFCWICMGDWHDHGANTGGYYKCNKYDSNITTAPEDQSDAAKAKRELDRYLHYYKRYHAHSEAQKFAKKQLKETENRMVLLQESSDDAKWSDVEFLKTANEQLVECRRVLKYTYVFAYYFGGNGGKQCMQKERFEHHQEMLERFTENLSELSEKPLAEMDRTDVVNTVRITMKNELCNSKHCCECFIQRASLTHSFSHIFILDSCGGSLHEKYLEVCGRRHGGPLDLR
jgi:ariadne-1